MLHETQHAHPQERHGALAVHKLLVFRMRVCCSLLCRSPSRRFAHDSEAISYFGGDKCSSGLLDSHTLKLISSLVLEPSIVQPMTISTMRIEVETDRHKVM